jgi:translation initiation factor IF-2
MSKKRVHEIAKEHGLSSKELLEKLKAAGVEAKAAASSVDEAVALKALDVGAAEAASSPNAPRPARRRPRRATDRQLLPPPPPSPPRRRLPPARRTRAAPSACGRRAIRAPASARPAISGREVADGL